MVADDKRDGRQFPVRAASLGDCLFMNGEKVLIGPERAPPEKWRRISEYIGTITKY